jgi:arylsulfatase A-like enzyme
VRAGRATRAAVALLLAAACGHGPPPELQVEDVVADLSAGADDGPGVTRAPLDPGDALRGDGARTALVVVPGATITRRVAVPEGGALRFGFGVDGSGRREAARSAVRFTVAVDGEAVFGRDVNPAADRHDRRWFDERVPLDRWRGRDVAVSFTVALASPDASPSGTAGWSRIRLVRTRAVARQRASLERPNVVVVLADTLRADAAGPGRAPSATPALDRLGAAGLVFTQAVAQSSWTLQSVSSLMTGLHSRAHGALGRHDRTPGAAAWGVLADGVVTWAEAAARAGITTVGVSANPLVSHGTNLAQGFETFVELPWDPEGRNWPDGEAVNAAFLRWLGDQGGYRFVAYLHYMEPHDPYTPPAPPAPAPGVRPAVARGWIRELANQVNWSRTATLSADEAAHLRDRYRGEVASWDDALGRLLDGLGSVRDRTIVVVTSDHGEEFLEHGRLVHGSHLYDETVRVPLVLQGPGVPAGRRDDQAQGIDLFPTLARLLGVEPPAGLPGRDLLAPPASAPAVLETSSGIGPNGEPLDLVAVRTQRWKLVETPALGRRELYDLAADAGERSDLGPTAPAAAELAAILDAWRGATPPAASVSPAQGLGERLRALGYAQ